MKKSLRRKSIRRKSIKRKSIKRKSIKRKSIKRKSIKIKSIKRKSIRRYDGMDIPLSSSSSLPPLPSPMSYIKLENYIDNIKYYNDKAFIHTLASFRIYDNSNDTPLPIRLEKTNLTFEFIKELFNFDRNDQPIIYFNRQTVLGLIIICGLYDIFEKLLDYNHEKIYCNEKQLFKTKKQHTDKLDVTQIAHINQIKIKDIDITKIINIISEKTNREIKKKFRCNDLENDIRKFIFYSICIESETRQTIMRHYLLNFIKSSIFVKYKDKIQLDTTSDSDDNIKEINDFLVFINEFKPLEYIINIEYKSKKFSTCGETTLLNILNYYFIDEYGNFTIKDKYSDNLKLFYTNYNTMKKQLNDINKTTIEWLDVVSNLTTDIYDKEGDIIPNKKNIEYVLKTILNSSKDDIKEILDEIIEKKIYILNDNEFGFEFLLDDKIKVSLTPGHAYLEKKKEKIELIEVLWDDNDCNNLYENIFSKIDYNQDYTRELNKIIVKYITEKRYTTKEVLYDLFLTLTQLKFGYFFNQPLGNSLDKLTNLTHLTFGDSFNQTLGNSLYELTNLTHLTFGVWFNQPLGNSLDKLTNLTHLTLGDQFEQPLGNSLDKLTNLTHLKFGRKFNKPLGNSLDKLTNLTHLTFGRIFQQPLGNSLDELTNLTHLTFGDEFNQLLGNSLDKLTNLTELTHGRAFNQPLGDSLYKLINLTHLTFGDAFNQTLGDSLYELTNLTHLTFGYEFKQRLGNSLDKLTNLTHLTFRDYFNKPLGNSLDELTNLTHLEFGDYFNQPLGNSLDKLTNLTHLEFGDDFNQTLGNSLYELTNLTHLTFGVFFNQPLGNSLDKLTNLTHLTLGDEFNQPLNLRDTVIVQYI
jgi:hypothetical protein